MQQQLIKGVQLILFVGFVAAQQYVVPDPLARQRPLPKPAEAEDIGLLSLGEATIAAKLLGFWLLTFDTRAAALIPFESMDYDRLAGWLDVIQDLDPLSAYPTMTAAGVFVDVKDSERARRMLDFVYRRYQEAPGLRWRWLAQAAMLAKYRLEDLDLALKYAQALRRRASEAAIPAWARDLEFIILQEMGEYESARLVIEVMLASGSITDPAELRFLEKRLEELKHKPRSSDR